MKTKINYNGRRVDSNFFGVAVKESGRAKAHSRRFPTVAKRQTKKGYGLMDKIKVGVCVAIIALSWCLCYSNNHSTKNAQSIDAKAADEDPGSTLPKWKVFTSHDMPANYDLFDKYFGDKASEARKVANCESGNRDIKSKMNRNGTYDYGRMQINTIWLKYYGLTESQMLDEETNISTAKKIYDRSNNWSAWSNSKSCHHL